MSLNRCRYGRLEHYRLIISNPKHTGGTYQQDKSGAHERLFPSPPIRDTGNQYVTSESITLSNPTFSDRASSPSPIRQPPITYHYQSACPGAISPSFSNMSSCSREPIDLRVRHLTSMLLMVFVISCKAHLSQLPLMRSSFSTLDFIDLICHYKEVSFVIF